MRYVVLLVVTVLVILLATFGIQNPIPVQVQFLQFQSSTVPLYLVVIISVLFGILVNGLLSIPGRIQRQRELRSLRHQVAQQTQQINDLKTRVPPPVMKPLPGEKS